MLERRQNCENCNKSLPVDSEDARICAFECTFCKDCVDEILQNVCPNCGGGFEKRPIMPKRFLSKYPPSDKKIFKPINQEEFKKSLKQYKNVKPAER